MRFVKLAVTAAISAITLAAPADAGAQEAPVRVWGVRVLATDVEALATFYAKTFGLSETSRPVNSATTKEVVLNVGATPDIAKRATAPPIVIYTRPATAPAGAMASLILRVSNLEKTIEAVKANGGTLMRPPGRNSVVNVAYAFVKDPDGNQIELVMESQ